MKTLSGNNPKPLDKGPDMGDMPIANAKYSCGNCPLKEECRFKVNTLNCMIALKRYKKQKSEEVVVNEDESDEEMVSSEKNALSELMKLALEEAPADDTEDD